MSKRMTRIIAPMLCALLAGCSVNETSSKSVLQKTTLIVIVPGTYGNSSNWPNVYEDKATFASELKRSFEAQNGRKCAIYSEIWKSSIFSKNREAAARRIADSIDAKSSDYERVCIIGHSHGGNVALMAAGLCRTKNRLGCLLGHSPCSPEHNLKRTTLAPSHLLLSRHSQKHKIDCDSSDASMTGFRPNGPARSLLA